MFDVFVVTEEAIMLLMTIICSSLEQPKHNPITNQNMIEPDALPEHSVYFYITIEKKTLCDI